MSERVRDEETLDESAVVGDALDESDDADPFETTDGSSDALDGDIGAVASGQSDADAAESAASGGRLSRVLPSVGIRRRLPGFSPRAFGLATLAAAAGILLGGAIPLVGGVAKYGGLFAAAFLLGLTDRAGYLEVAPAGAIAAGVSVLVGTLSAGTFVLGVDLLQRYGVAVAGVGVSVGFLLAVAGLYFGRDLRAGVTRSV